MKVLLAEDDPQLRAAFAEAAAGAGHELLCAMDADAAWSLFEQERPPLVVVDLDLPPADGLALCRRIRAAERGAPRAARTPAGEPTADLAPGPHADLEAELEADLAAALAAEGLLAASVPPAVAGGPPTFLLVVAPQGRTADLTAALDAGADDYLLRPAVAGTLVARLAIAERRMVDDARRRAAEAELRRARWLAGVGETSIALQHQINNPLAALLGHAALLEQGLVEPGEERELLAVITEQAHRIAAVVKRLADLRDPRSVEYLRGARMLDLEG